MPKELKIEVGLGDLHTAYFSALKEGSFTQAQIISVVRRGIIEIAKRDASKLEPIFNTVKRLYYNYWKQYESPAAIRRMQESKLAELNKEMLN